MMPKFIVSTVPLKLERGVSTMEFVPVHEAGAEEQPKPLPEHRDFPVPKKTAWSDRRVPNTKQRNSELVELSVPRTVAVTIFTCLKLSLGGGGTGGSFEARSPR